MQHNLQEFFIPVGDLLWRVEIPDNVILMHVLDELLDLGFISHSLQFAVEEREHQGILLLGLAILLGLEVVVVHQLLGLDLVLGLMETLDQGRLLLVSPIVVVLNFELDLLDVDRVSVCVPNNLIKNPDVLAVARPVDVMALVPFYRSSLTRYSIILLVSFLLPQSKLFSKQWVLVDHRCPDPIKENIRDKRPLFNIAEMLIRPYLF